MQLTKNIYEDIALILATIIASLYVLLCFLGLYFSVISFTLEFYKILIISFFLSGILGYNGFLNLIFFGYEKKLKQTLLLLMIGVIAYSTALILPRHNFLDSLKVNNLGDLFEKIILLWPLLVGIYFGVKISKKLIQEKKY